MSGLIGRTLGQYQLLDEIGRGGMANVYRAIQPSVDREVAVKVLPTQFLQDSTFLDRFAREVQIIARLQHPRILPVIDFGEEDGLPYIVMAYMARGTLMGRIRRYPTGMPFSDVARIVHHVAEGLDFAHRQGIIHRDIKPNNILFDSDGNPYLGDFGIAKVAETTANLTMGVMLGTPGYMAPELGEPGEPTTQVDVYALGVTVFEMLTGSLPFIADTPLRIMYLHVNQPIPDVSDFRDDLPAGIDQVIQHALAKDPAERYSSAVDLAHDLSGLDHSLTLHGSGDWPTEPAEDFPDTLQMGPDEFADTAPSRKRRLPLLIGFGAVLLLLLAGFFIFKMMPGQRTDVPPAAEISPTDVPPTDSPTLTIESTQPGDVPTAPPVTVGATVQRLAGDVNLRSAASDVFEPLAELWVLVPGDSIRTGVDSYALLFFIQGVHIELQPDSLITLDSVRHSEGGWQIDVTQLEGLALHVVTPDSEIEYIVHSPAAVVTVTGTSFRAEAQAEGWCYVALEGTLLVDVGELDQDPADDVAVDAEDEPSLLVGLDGSTQEGACEIADSTQDDEVASGGSGGGFLPAATQVVDPCANNGGLQWQGTTCLCSGILNNVIICQDGSKSDSPTTQTCQPASSCTQGQAGGGGGGGGSGGAQPGCGPCGTFTDTHCHPETSEFCYDYIDGCGNWCYETCESSSCS